MPPALFRLLRKSVLYDWVVRLVKGFEKPVLTKEIKISSGDLSGFVLKLSGQGAWQREMINGEYDKELFSCVRKMDLQDKVVYDIGSHIGYHSLAFSTYVGKKGRVYAFEPNQANVDRANEIVALNKGVDSIVTTLHTALSDSIGSANFLSTDNIENGTSTGGFIENSTTIWPKEVFVKETGFSMSEVPVNTIDNLVQSGEILPPDLMKIDVEGAEQMVLTGAEKTITEHRPLIIVEFHSIQSAYICMRILSKHGYQTDTLKEEVDGRVMILAT